MKRRILLIGFAVTFLAAAGSLFMSEILNWTPCVLCWYQRTMLYPLVIVFAVAVVKQISNVEFIIWPMVVIGGLIAVYHNLLQYNIISEELALCVNGISCVTNYNLGLSFLSVPLLSLITFMFLGLLMAGYRKANA